MVCCQGKGYPFSDVTFTGDFTMEESNCQCLGFLCRFLVWNAACIVCHSTGNQGDFVLLCNMLTSYDFLCFGIWNVPYEFISLSRRSLEWNKNSVCYTYDGVGDCVGSLSGSNHFEKCDSNFLENQ